MKTYVTTTEKPRLQIFPDDMATSPRGDHNLGYFLTKDKNLQSPDGEKAPILQKIMEETAEEAEDQSDHMEKMAQRTPEETGETISFIMPVTKYEHGAVMYKAGNYFGWDYSQNGFYIVTKESQKNILDADEEEANPNTKMSKEIIEEELETYNKWINGEVYRFVLFDERGNLEDETGDLYLNDLEEIRRELPDEWQDEDLEEYIIY